MTKHQKYKELFHIERVLDEHLIRPELISKARDRLFIEATKQLVLCDQFKCCGGTGNCDNSCQEARSFITGKNIPGLDEEEDVQQD